LYTGIAGSTRLASRLGEQYTEVLSKHNNLIRSLNQVQKNKVIELIGDGFFMAFDEAKDAIHAAIAIQQAISHYRWPSKEEVTIRIGLHWGQALPYGSTFTGIEVHKTSRIRSAAHGGQILLSQPLANQIRKQRIEHFEISRIGEFLLRDFDKSVTLLQVRVPGQKITFPLPRTVSASPSVAVLPFHNIDDQSAEEYLGLGIAEEIISSLSKNPEVRVLARATTFGINKKYDIKELGEKLNAKAILEGTVRKENSNITITAELVDAKSGANMWILTYEGDQDELLAIQDKITTQITSSLLGTSDDTVKDDIQTAQTQNFEAYEKYLMGKKFYYQYSQQSIEFALQMFGQALQHDKNYAHAYCGLADCYSYLFMYSNPNNENLNKAIFNSNKAIEINPDLAEAHASYGVALSLKGNFDESEEAFEKAIELNPMLFEAQYQYARMIFSCGDYLKAAELFEAASRIRQDDYQSLLLNGQCYDSLGMPEKATDTRVRGIRIAEEVLQLNPGNTRALYMGANGLVAIDEQEKGLEWLQRALTLDPNDPMLLYNAGCIYSLCSKKEEALNCLEQAVATGLTQKGWYEHDSNLDILRKEQRFINLLSSL
ncbi:MAG: FlgO family outer membrane protein, partial [Bacteroidota bacterium]